MKQELVHFANLTNAVGLLQGRYDGRNQSFDALSDFSVHVSQLILRRAIAHYRAEFDIPHSDGDLDEQIIEAFNEFAALTRFERSLVILMVAEMTAHMFKQNLTAASNPNDGIPDTMALTAEYEITPPVAEKIPPLNLTDDDKLGKIAEEAAIFYEKLVKRLISEQFELEYPITSEQLAEMQRELREKLAPLTSEEKQTVGHRTQLVWTMSLLWAGDNNGVD